MHAIRMLETVEGSPNGHTVYTYTAGETYSHESMPPISAYLMAAWVAQGRAVAVDAAGNPVGTPATRRAAKDAVAPESAPEGDSDAVAPESVSDDNPATAETADATETAAENAAEDEASETSETSGKGRGRGK